MKEAKELLSGAYIAEAMAQALFMQTFGGCNTPARDKKLLSAVRHTQSRRDFGTKMVEKYSAILANTTEGYLMQDAIDHIADYKKLAANGLDRPCHPIHVEAALKIRVLKNDARKLKRMAYALCESDFDKESLIFVAMSSPTYLDYTSWVKAA